MLDFLIDNAWGLLIDFVIIGVLVAPRNLRGSYTSTQNEDDSMKSQKGSWHLKAKRCPQS